MTKDEFDALKLVQGTVVKLHWMDICEDSVGDTKSAELVLRHTYTLFWETKISKGVDCIITCNTLDKDTTQQGWCCTPILLVSKIGVIKRPPTKRKKAV